MISTFVGELFKVVQVSKLLLEIPGLIIYIKSFHFREIS